ncbi:hypothetical protein [Chroococcus sp. FPU101]|nr:hypothetical protein [Chroococcus sp. FPU101]
MAAKTTKEPILILKNVGKAYEQPNRQLISIIDNINLELRQGEIVALFF